MAERLLPFSINEAGFRPLFAKDSGGGGKGSDPTPHSGSIFGTKHETSGTPTQEELDLKASHPDGTRPPTTDSRGSKPIG